ncbi:hypothetical protein L7F22_068457 [Adiantum nelumboides]|nr:hypothetical protein [Adiantum nelumboides]
MELVPMAVDDGQGDGVPIMIGEALDGKGKFLGRHGEGEEVSRAVGMVFELLDACDAIVDGADALAPVGVVLLVLTLDQMLMVLGLIEYEELKEAMREFM